MERGRTVKGWRPRRLGKLRNNIMILSSHINMVCACASKVHYLNTEGECPTLCWPVQILHEVMT